MAILRPIHQISAGFENHRHTRLANHPHGGYLHIQKRSGAVEFPIRRPYQHGSLFRKSNGKELHALAKDVDCTSWGQFYLQFTLGHPAVTCIIPATSKTHHMIDNMQANFGQVPDQSQRKEMLAIFSRL